MRKAYLLIAMSVLSLGAFAQTYCTAGPSSTADSEIINVQLTGDNFSIANLLTCPAGAGVQDFTATDSADVSLGTGYSLNVTFSTCGGLYTSFGRAWIDWNQDGDFLDAGEELGSWGPSTPAPQNTTSYNATFAFIVPSTATLGETRMRVMQRESGSTTTTTPCATFTWGSVEDYQIKVTNTPPPCPTPGALSVSNVGAYGATFHWSSTGSAFNIEYGVSGFTLGNGTSTTSTADSIVITGLTPATNYQFYVQNNCTSAGNGTSNWAGPFTFLTGCAPFSTPFTEGFDNASTGNTSNPNPPTCWTYYETPGHAGWGYTYSSSFNTSYTAPNMFYFYNSSNITDSIILASPEIIGLDSSNKQVVFYLKTNTASYDSPMIVGTMSDPNVPSSFNTIATVTATQNWQEFIVALDSASGYNGTDKHLAFMYKNVNTFDACYLDNITVEAIPPCPKPNLLSLGLTTNSSQELNWVSGGTKFVIEYGPVGFVQGTGMLDTVFNTNTATVTGLAGNSTYDAYIMNDCSGAGNGISVWAGPITFTTLCNPFAGTVTEDFDGITASNSTVNPGMPPCWGYWESPGAVGYGYTYSFLSPYSAPNHMRFYNSSNYTNNDTMMIISPEMIEMDTNFYQIEFYAKGGSTSTNSKLFVGTVSSPSNPGSLVVLDTITCTGTTWTYFKVFVDPANGYNQSHKFLVIGDANTTNFLSTYIDDITISPIPACTPSGNLSAFNITNNTAWISWTAGDGLNQQIEYGPSGFVQGTGPVLTGLSDSTQLTNLTANTMYDVYIRDSCAGQLSPWFGPFTFQTLCDAQPVPYTENFDGITASNSTTDPGMPDCWFYYKNPAHLGYGYSYSFLTPNSAPNHFRMYNSSSLVDTLAIISPAIQGITNGNLLVKFYAKSNTTSYNSPVIVGTMGSPDDPSSMHILDTVQAPSSYTEFTVYLDTASGYNGMDQHVFLMHGNGGTFRSLYLDDITVEAIPSCTPPWNLAANNITASGASISWTTLQGTCFKVEYGPTGFIQGTGNGSTISNTTSPTTLIGLNPNTYYDVYVADCCDSTVFSGPFTFKTNCVSQLNGTYTVGGATSDFATLDSAMATLVGCGVSGAVTFNLQGGTHNIPGYYIDAIQGVSATNTITFNGTGVATDTIKFLSGSFGFDMDGASYLTFQNLTIDGSGRDRTVWLHNNAHHITFNNCHIWNTPGSTSFNTSIIAATESATSPTAYGNNANDITITNCKLVGGYYGIVFNGTAATNKISGFTFENNVIEDVYYYGVRFYYAADISVKQNIFSGTLANYGLYCYYMDDFEIERNDLDGNFSGIYLGYANTYRTDTPTVASTFTNNFVKGNSTYAMYMYSVGYLNIYHNSVNGTGTYGMYMSGTSTYPGTNVDIRNNIIVGGSNYSLYAFTTTYSNISLDYNIYHTTGGTNLAYWNTAYATLAAWQTGASAYNTNSLSGDPGFLSSSDLHIVGTLPNDEGYNGLSSIDFDGDSRPASGATNVDIGADEFTPLNWDASLQGLIIPMAGCGDSAMAASVIVKNFGLNTITSLPVTINVTGGVTATMSTTASVNIPQGATDTVSVGTFNTYAGALGVMFDASVALVGDQKSSNDTASAGPGAYIPYEPVTTGMVDTVCASGDSVDLYAVYIPGTNYAWYDVPTGGTKIANGDTLTVPANGQSTYYVEYDSATANPQVGAGTTATSSTYITPYKTFYMDGRAQYLILASEMAALGVSGGGEINSLAFEVATPAAQSMNAFTIKLGGTSVSQMTGSFQPNTNMTTVYSTTYTVTSGWNVHTFTTPFIWNGADNILVEVCFDNSSWTSNSSVYYSTTTFPSVTDGYADLSGTSGCTPGQITNQQASTSRPNMQFNIKTIACSNIRKPVSFAVYQDTAIAAAFNAAVQANGADVNFDGSASNGDIYSWNFGDGNLGSGVTPSHTYANAGTYNVCLTVEDTVCGTVDSICQTVTATIGLEESLINQTLAIYPNPNNGKFRVEFQVEGLQEVEIRVVSLLGQVMVSSKPGNVSGSYREEIDLSNEAAGVYIVQLVTEDGTVSRRITIRK